jgi:transposase-like protein
MRYAQRGGYTPAEHERRERLRLQAAGRFVAGDGINEIARDLRVTPGSVRRWHRAWRVGGTEAARPKGPVSRERLSPQQWARLEQELAFTDRYNQTARPFNWKFTAADLDRFLQRISTRQEPANLPRAA